MPQHRKEIRLREHSQKGITSPSWILWKCYVLVKVYLCVAYGYNRSSPLASIGNYVMSVSCDIDVDGNWNWRVYQSKFEWEKYKCINCVEKTLWWVYVSLAFPSALRYLGFIFLRFSFEYLLNYNWRHQEWNLWGGVDFSNRLMVSVGEHAVCINLVLVILHLCKGHSHRDIE